MEYPFITALEYIEQHDAEPASNLRQPTISQGRADKAILFSSIVIPKTSAFKQTVKLLRLEFLIWENRARRRNKREILRLDLAISVILTQCIRARMNLSSLICIPKSKESLRRDLERMQIDATPHDIVKLIHWFSHLGYIRLHQLGSSFQESRSENEPRFRHTLWSVEPSFNSRVPLELNSVVIAAIAKARFKELKAAKCKKYLVLRKRGDLKDEVTGQRSSAIYRQTAETRRMIENLNKINACYLETEIEINLSPDDLQSLGPYEPAAYLLGDDCKRSLDLGSKIVHRVFYEGFEEDGRFYGGFWRYIKSEFREHITINGERTRELDFKGFQLAALCAKHCLPIPADPYTIEGIDRSLVKEMVTMWLNGYSRRTARSYMKSNVLNEGFFPEHLDWNEAVEAIEQLFDPYSDFIGECWNRKIAPGSIIRLWDAQIAEKVMVHFVDQGIPVLDIHDSFIVVERHADELYRVMIDAAREVLGVYEGATGEYDLKITIT